MTVTELITLLAQVSGLLFVVCSMLGMGMSFTVSQIIEPLKNPRLVILALLGNFVLVPLLAYGITYVIPLDDALRTGVIILGCAAGAPFLIKEVQIAKGNLALGVGMMFLLMIATILFMPIVLPLLLPGAEVNAWDLAKSLIFSMALPLVIGLMVKSYLEEDAARWSELMNKISGLAMIIFLVIAMGLNIPNIIDLIGSYGFLALFVLVLGAIVIGYLLGGRDPGLRNVMVLGTAQRNIAAAILVTALNFSDTPTLPYILAGSIILPIVLIPTARILGGRSEQAEGKPGS